MLLGAICLILASPSYTTHPYNHHPDSLKKGNSSKALFGTVTSFIYKKIDV